MSSSPNPLSASVYPMNSPPNPLSASQRGGKEEGEYMGLFPIFKP
jgi:hypothetical protein